MLHREAPRRVAEDRIGLTREAAELRVHQPGRLHELELPLDVGVEADEDQALRAGRGVAVHAAAPHDAMLVHEPLRLCRGEAHALRQSIARVRAPDVRAERATETMAVLPGVAAGVAVLEAGPGGLPRRTPPPGPHPRPPLPPPAP